MTPILESHKSKCHSPTAWLNHSIVRISMIASEVRDFANESVVRWVGGCVERKCYITISFYAPSSHFNDRSWDNLLRTV